jgi:DNA-binding LytR/AlgR family response regulator
VGLASALGGDAAVRVVVADALGSASSRAASGTDFQAVPLAELLVDPYAAVRFVAGRSLHALSGYADVPYDFLASPEARERARSEVLARFAASGAGSRRTAEDRARLGLTAPGTPDRARLDALLAARDMRRITIAE